MSARSWCIVINNYTDEDIMALESMNYRYLIYGFEIGESGTPHIQGYIELGRVMRWTAIKKIIPRAHLDQRRGTRERARNYCKKGEQTHAEWDLFHEEGPNYGLNAEFVEFGDWNLGGQGRRTDLDFIREKCVDEGMRSVTAIGNLQQIKVAEKYLQYNEEGRDWKPQVVWLYGPTGVGKSRMARNLCDGDYYAKKDGTKWWDGYDNHEEVIIDDFRDSWWSFTTMLSLLDRYEHIVECKGASRQFRARTIIITSAHAPIDCYKNVGEDINQLLRRIDIIECVGNPTSNTDLLEEFTNITCNPKDLIQLQLDVAPPAAVASVPAAAAPQCPDIELKSNESVTLLCNNVEGVILRPLVTQLQEKNVDDTKYDNIDTNDILFDEIKKEYDEQALELKLSDIREKYNVLIVKTLMSRKSQQIINASINKLKADMDNELIKMQLEFN